MTNTIAERDKEYIWHPYTQHQTASLSLPIVSGQGAYLFDAQGKRYLDLISSWWVNIHGHGHPQIAHAIYEQALQLEQVIFAGFTHPPAVTLAEQLLRLLPSAFKKVFYSDNGSTAVEVALKMAHQYWRHQGEKKRTRFLAFSGGYHGDTFGAMSVGRSSHFFQHFSELLFQVDIAPYPETWEGDDHIIQKEQDALAWLDHYFNQFPSEVAAVIIEPLIQGASGMRVCRPEFLRALEALTHRYGILTIYDEVMTGFGRTGELFACTKSGTQPDIICLSKGLTGGFLPLAVTACQEYLYQAFLGPSMDAALVHGHSYTANPLGCAAAIASLQLLTEESTQKQIRLIEATHREMLRDMESLSCIEKRRHCGTIAAFNVTASEEYGSLKSQQWREVFLERGLLIRPLGSVVYFLPPYCVPTDALREAYAEVIEFFKELAIG